MDATLISVNTHCIIGHSHSHPQCSVTAGTSAHHLQDKRLVGVCHREGLALGVVAVLLSQLIHNLDGFASGLGSLQGDVDQRTVVDDACGINHLFAAAKGGLGDYYLMLVHIAHHVVGHRGLVNLAPQFIAFPVEDLALRTLGVSAGREVLHHAVSSIAVGVVAYKHAAVFTGFLANDDIGAGHAYLHSHNCCNHEKNCFFHILMIFV